MDFSPHPLAPFALSLEQAQMVVSAFGWTAVAVWALPGVTKDVFEIALEDHSRVILKTYGDGMTWNLLKEAHVAGLIGDRFSTPTPRWLKADETKTILPCPYALITALEGAALTGRHHKPEAEELYRQLGAALKGLSNVTLPSFGYIVGDGYLRAYDNNLDYMTTAFKVKFRDFAELGGDPKLISQLKAQVAAGEQAMGRCSQAVLCHNDIHPGNVLAGQNEDGTWRITGLVDLENATGGDPLFDLAKALNQVTHDYLPGRDPLLEGYGSLGRADAWTAIKVYRIYHKLEMRNWLVAKGQDPASPGPANLLADLKALVS